MTGAEAGGALGAVFGLLVGAAVLWRVHPLLGLLTVLGGIAQILH